MDKEEADLKKLLAKMLTPFPKFAVEPKKTALLLIDMQKLAGPEWIVQEAIEKGVAEKDARDAVSGMNKRFKKVNRNAKGILEACRKKGIIPIHLKIEAITKDGRDVGRLHKRLNFVIPPGSDWAEFFDEVKPKKGEIILAKTCSGAFVGTHLDRILRNMEIETLIIIGYYTDQCVTTAARDAADLGYDSILIEDACSAPTMEHHKNAIEALRDVYVKVETTKSLLEDIEKL